MTGKKITKSILITAAIVAALALLGYILYLALHKKSTNAAELALHSAASTCHDDNDCPNHTCARPFAGLSKTACCPSGHKHLYAGHYYCTDMPNGTPCQTGAVCASGYCKEGGVLSIGRCETPPPPPPVYPNGARCGSYDDCESGCCAYGYCVPDQICHNIPKNISN